MTDRAEEGAGTLAALGTQLAEMSNVLAAQDGSVDPKRVVAFAVQSVPHALQGNLTVLRPDEPAEVLAASHPDALAASELQHRLREGPSLDAVRGREVVGGDLPTDARWPRFGPRCVELTGWRAVLSIPVLFGSEDRAALTLYGTTAFDEMDLGLASIVAPYAGIAVGSTLRRRDVVDLTEALAASRQIGMAIGVLMARHKVTSAEALGMLHRASWHLGATLPAVAARVEETGTLPVIASG